MLNHRPKHVLFQIKNTECFSLWLVWGEPGTLISNPRSFIGKPRSSIGKPGQKSGEPG